MKVEINVGMLGIICYSIYEYIYEYIYIYDMRLHIADNTYCIGSALYIYIYSYSSLDKTPSMSNHPTIQRRSMLPLDEI